MERSFVLVLWIASLLSVISHSKARIPLRLRCTSRPIFSTFSKSSGAPFLSAEPHLSFLPNYIAPAQIPDREVKEIPERPEITYNTFVILHKLNKNDDKHIEITITNDRKETKDDQSLSNDNINIQDEEDKNEMIYETMDHGEMVDSSNDDRVVDEAPGDDENLLVQDDENLLVQDDENLLVQDDENLLVQDDENLLVQDDENLLVQGDENLLVQDDENLLVQDDKNLLVQDDENLLVQGDENLLVQDDEINHDLHLLDHLLDEDSMIINAKQSVFNDKLAKETEVEDDSFTDKNN